MIDIIGVTHNHTTECTPLVVLASIRNTTLPNTLPLQHLYLKQRRPVSTNTTHSGSGRAESETTRVNCEARGTPCASKALMSVFLTP